jgi:cell division protein FtsL
MSAAPAAAVRRTSVKAPRSATPPVLRVVAAPKRRRGYIAYLSLCLVLLVTALVGVLSLNTALAQGSFEMHELEGQLANYESEKNQIQEELTQHGAPANLAAKAQELGMVAPQGTAFILLKQGTVVGATGPATTDKSAESAESAEPSESTGGGDSEAGAE